MSVGACISEGFKPIPIFEPFTTRIGPIYAKDEEKQFRLGFLADETYLNSENVVNAGMLSTLADQAIGVNVAQANGQHNDVLTIHLPIDFISPALLIRLY
jgi:acyl-coenzyme A thioesterase 13